MDRKRFGPGVAALLAVGILTTGGCGSETARPVATSARRPTSARNTPWVGATETREQTHELPPAQVVAIAGGGAGITGFPFSQIEESGQAERTPAETAAPDVGDDAVLQAESPTPATEIAATSEPESDVPEPEPKPGPSPSLTPVRLEPAAGQAIAKVDQDTSSSPLTRAARADSRLKGLIVSAKPAPESKPTHSTPSKKPARADKKPVDPASRDQQLAIKSSTAADRADSSRKETTLATRPDAAFRLNLADDDAQSRLTIKADAPAEELSNPQSTEAQAAKQSSPRREFAPVAITPADAPRRAIASQAAPQPIVATPAKPRSEAKPAETAPTAVAKSESPEPAGKDPETLPIKVVKQAAPTTRVVNRIASPARVPKQEAPPAKAVEKEKPAVEITKLEGLPVEIAQQAAPPTQPASQEEPTNVAQHDAPQPEVVKQELPPVEIATQAAPPIEVAQQAPPPVEVANPQAPPSTVIKQELPPVEVATQAAPPIEVAQQAAPPVEVANPQAPPATVVKQELPPVEVAAQATPPIEVARQAAPPANIARQQAPPTQVASQPVPRPMTAAPSPPEAMRHEIVPHVVTPREISPQDLPSGLFVQRNVPPTRSPEAMVVITHADQRVAHGFELARRGAIYVARSEFMAAIKLIAQANDIEQGTRTAGKAATAGLVALKESADFVRQIAGPQDVDVTKIVAQHTTSVLKGSDLSDMTPSVAAEAYYAHAREQLSMAIGRELVGSMALYGLGKATLTAAGGNFQQMEYTGQAMAFYQAALLVEPKNVRAANELGVLLANHGQLRQAQEMLARSATLAPNPATWQNLAVVHARMGDRHTAEQVQKQAREMPGAGRNPATPAVQWVDPATFAGVAPSADILAPPADSAKTKANPGKTAPEAAKPPANVAKRITDWLPLNLHR